MTGLGSRTSVFRLLLVVLFLADASPLFGKSDYDTLKELFESGTRPSLSEFESPAAWAGKAVAVSRPDSRYAALLFVNPTHDPVFGDKLYFMSVTGDVAEPETWALNCSIHRIERDFERAVAKAAEGEWKSVKVPHAPTLGLLYKYCPLGQPGSLKEVRKAIAPDGTPLYLKTSWCIDPGGCFDQWDERVSYGQPTSISYFWVNRFAASASSTLPAKDPLRK